MIECRECKGSNFIKKYCQATERMVYDDCWDCLADEMYEVELQNRLVKILTSEPSEELLTLLARVVVGGVLNNKRTPLQQTLLGETSLEYNSIWNLLRDIDG